ncbi:MAG TPA: class I SAM-dependent methyltransferase [Propionibacteriaceae bacterium]|nr:class I SAM-dependent methyltransferase [Propionibacteriaceae bacterium]
MEERDVAAWLVSGDATPWLKRAALEPDLESLATADRWRRELPPDKAAAVLGQASLRRVAAAKLGERASGLFLTRDGLEQATRAPVARWRAERFATGITEVWDLGCGLGLDALAMVDAGLRVTAVEKDAVTATFAQANLGAAARVVLADVADVYDDVPPGAGLFLDPARRTARGRSWDVADLSPSWDVVSRYLETGRVACVKLGPGVPYRLLPDRAETVWVSDHGDLVEAAVWTGPGATPGRRGALLLPSGASLEATAEAPGVGPVQRWLYEPDPAVIRSGSLAALAGLLGAASVAPGVAYLTAAEHRPTPYATAFEVLASLPYRERDLRAWVRTERIGTLEIKKRGLDVDPAALRRRLAPRGPGSATLILTPTPGGAVALVVRRAVG